MDRTAWIAVTLCVIALVAWEWWVAKQTPLRLVATPTFSPTPAPLAGVSPSIVPTISPAPIATATATPAPTATPAFAEKIETLRNDDVELRLTNRGGGIAEAMLLNHIGQGDRVVINSKDQPPIGAMIDQPNAPKLDEFTLTREADGAVKCEHAADSVTVRKKFF